MRITMVNKYYPPHVGGIEFHARDLAEGLVKAGHEVRMVVSNSGPDYVEETINGVSVARLPRLFEKASTPVVRNFGHVLGAEARQSEIMHFHFPYPWGEFEWIRQPESKTVPYVVTYHTDIVRQKVALAAYKPFMQTFLNRARLIMASSSQLIEYSEILSSRKSQCRQVNFGLPVEYIAHNAAAIAHAAQIKARFGQRKIVLFVGRLVYYKGVDVLVNAMPDVDAEFVVIGKGPLRDDMVKRASELGVENRLTFVDFATDEELIAWYHAADVLALPSVLPSEAFGLVQIEAHAAGTPTVSTLLKSGVPYANLDGITGRSVAVGSAPALAQGLNEILLNDELRARLGATAKHRALTEFTIDAMVRKVEAVYLEAVSE